MNTPSREQLTKIFVYGTLKPGEVNYHICAAKVIESRPAIAQGQLFALPFGYPAMILGTGSVYGVILSFADAAILQALDEFEQHDPEEFTAYVAGQLLEQNQYQRQQILVFDQQGSPVDTAWTYLMTHQQINRLGGIHLPDGYWRN